ncbi:lipopolysaccharide biosynthesis protein [Bacillus wiedmannii]|uniref:lipopolysaccharide biosynthesis protein n=1 Tax=Bacillus wiedmannii TaxID=1890302 RepID=UPI001245984A|nr:oligosaccharide flippase family protein [Bacillus wiedmannii]
MEKNIINSGIKNIIYMLAAQGVSLSLSFLTAFILPMFLGVEQFGYWQIYLLYTAYVGIFCMGYNDGLYLRYGNYDYDELPFDLLRASIKPFLMMLFVLTCVIITVLVLGESSDKTFVFLMVASNIFIQGLNGTFTIVYQFTNRIKLYSVSTVLNKILLLFIISSLLVMNINNYQVIIMADIAIKIVVLFFNIYFCKELLFGKTSSLISGFLEMKENMQVGISLMVANLMGMLIFGIGNFLVERFLRVQEYGMYAFAISSTNLTILFISSISLALYPMLKRLSEKSISYYYEKINIILCTLIFGMLFLYFPIYWVVEHIMTEYRPILSYLYFLFPIVVTQGKIQLLVNTYYKILREEKAMLKANISSVIVFLIIGVPAFFVFRSVTWIAVCTLITMVWRCYASEIYLKKKLGIKEFKNIFLELTIIALFIIFARFEHIILGMLCHLAVVCLYFFIHFNVIKSYFIKIVRSLLPNKDI